MADSAARRRLADTQRALLESLVAGAAPPAGFDPDRIRIQAAALAAKRAASVARHRPDVVERIERRGGRYREVFAAYAAAHPKPPGGGAADADAFAGWLRRAGSGYGRPSTSSWRARRRPV
ncbi:MAG: hypothetical protein ACJ73S_12480 [Mycobacteriales bacterium]